jgi:exosortase/archaeosortase family protein
VIAMSALAAACSAVCFGKRMQLWLWGLMLLSLPLIPSLNFFAGYPLRVVVGDIACVLLNMNGFAVMRDGASLLWNEQQIAIDAPCSGIKMLWTGAYLSCALAGFMRFGALRTLLLGSLALCIVILANVVRATALFYVEGGIVPQAQSAHELIGVIIFAVAAIVIAGVAMQLGKAQVRARLGTEAALGAHGALGVPFGRPRGG